jgi:hypothetical protein
LVTQPLGRSYHAVLDIAVESTASELAAPLVRLVVTTPQTAATSLSGFGKHAVEFAATLEGTDA